MCAQQRCLHSCQQRNVVCVPAGLCPACAHIEAGFRVLGLTTCMRQGKGPPHRAGLKVDLPVIAIACMRDGMGMSGLSPDTSCTPRSNLHSLWNHTKHLQDCEGFPCTTAAQATVRPAMLLCYLNLLNRVSPGKLQNAQALHGLPAAAPVDQPGAPPLSGPPTGRPSSACRRCSVCRVLTMWCTSQKPGHWAQSGTCTPDPQELCAWHRRCQRSRRDRGAHCGQTGQS